MAQDTPKPGPQSPTRPDGTPIPLPVPPKGQSYSGDDGHDQSVKELLFGKQMLSPPPPPKLQQQHEVEAHSKPGDFGKGTHTTAKIGPHAEGFNLHPEHLESLKQAQKQFHGLGGKAAPDAPPAAQHGVKPGSQDHSQVPKK